MLGLATAPILCDVLNPTNILRTAPQYPVASSLRRSASGPRFLFILPFFYSPSDGLLPLSFILADHGDLPGGMTQTSFLKGPDHLYNVGLLGVPIHSYYGEGVARSHLRGSLGSTQILLLHCVKGALPLPTGQDH